VEKSGTGDFAKHATRVLRQTPGQLTPDVAIEGTRGIQIIGAVKNAADHVPLGEPDRVIPHRIQHPAVRLSLGLGVSGARRSVPQRG
jgi:hypothetical protein